MTILPNEAVVLIIPTVRDDKSLGRFVLPAHQRVNMFSRTSIGFSSILLLLSSGVLVHGEVIGMISKQHCAVLPPAVCCDSCNLPRDCPDVDCRSWRITANANFLERSRPDSLVLIQDTTDPTRSLNAAAFDFGFHAGWELSAARRLRSGDEIEFRYFGVDQFDAIGNVETNPAGGLVRINTNPATFDPAVQAIAARYESQLHNFELNLRRPWGKSFTLLGGFRYLEVDERLHADLTTSAPTFTYDTLTRNRLYGAQIGAAANLWGGGTLAVDATAKTGIFANAGGHSTIHDTTAATDTAIDTTDHAAFVGELGVAGRYRLTDCLSARVGYQFLWIESVSLASEQIPATDFGSAGGINIDGNAFYHGASVGLELRR